MNSKKYIFNELFLMEHASIAVKCKVKIYSYVYFCKSTQFAV